MSTRGGKGRRAPGSRLTQAEVDEIFRRFHEPCPHPKGELDYINPFTLLVAVVLSAQATDAGVNKATPALFAVADTPEKMVGLGVAGIEDHIKTIGLYHNKAKAVFALSQKNSSPSSARRCPTAARRSKPCRASAARRRYVVLNIAFRQPTIAVDTHLFRVGNRTGLAPGRRRSRSRPTSSRSCRSTILLHAHHWLILHGRYVCKARTPECWRCPHRRVVPVRAQDASAWVVRHTFCRLNSSPRRLHQHRQQSAEA